MARAFRIDGFTQVNGHINVSYTDGTAPLGAARGSGMEFQSKADAIAVLQDAINNLSSLEVMALVAIKVLRLDPTLATPANLIGKTCTIDLTSATPIVLS